MKRSFVVLGAGAWGSALALHLARLDHAVVLWGHEAAEVADLVTQKRHEAYLPGIVFPDSMQVTSDIAQAFSMAGQDPIILAVVPSFAFEATMQLIHPYLKASTPVLWGTKGLSSQNEFLHVVCRRQTGERPMGVLSGPSFAMEVARELPTAVTIAMTTSDHGKMLQEAFHSERFRVYLSSDLIGVQLGGVIKNCIAIAVGMSDGLGYGANARAALITRGLAELSRLGQVLGANLQTFLGLSGVGDMTLTCTDNQSRNRRFGLALGEGLSIDGAIGKIGKVVEGNINVRQVIALAKAHQIEMPICQQVFNVLYENSAPQDAVLSLLMRSPKKEL